MESKNYVLILDDNAEFCEGLKAVLINAGIESESFLKAEPGIAHFKAIPSSIIFLDVRYVREGDPPDGKKETGIFVFMQLKELIKKYNLSTKIVVISGDPEAVKYPSEVLGLDKEFIDIVPIEKDRLDKNLVLDIIKRQFGKASISVGVEDHTVQFQEALQKLKIVDTKRGVRMAPSYEEALINQNKHPDTSISKLRYVLECVTDEMCKYEVNRYRSGDIGLKDRIDALLNSKVFDGFVAQSGRALMAVFNDDVIVDVKVAGNKAIHNLEEKKAPSPSHAFDVLLKSTQILEYFFVWFEKTNTRKKGRIHENGIRTNEYGTLNNFVDVIFDSGRTASLHRNCWLDSIVKFHDLKPHNEIEFELSYGQQGKFFGLNAVNAKKLSK